MKIRLRWFAILVAPITLILATAGAANAAPALPGAAPAPKSAAPTSIAGDGTTITPQAIGDCPATYLCVWVNIGYSLGPARFAGNNERWYDYSSDACKGGNWNDCASSGFNNGTSGLGVEIFRDDHYHGASACLPKGWHHPDFTKLVWPGTSLTLNDSITSNRWTDIC